MRAITKQTLWEKQNEIGNCVGGGRDGGLVVAAPASAQGVKIGILNDQSGVYADYGGKYSVEAAKMAIEDFGGNVLGQKIEIDLRRPPEQARSRPPASRGAGTTSKTST